ncbi:MAG TPA: NAD(P)-dependent oxidoreductase [Nevskiaceae bacterium]
MGRIDQAVALREGRIAAAALDVFDGEPEVNPALLDCDHLVLSPHIVSATTGARRRMAAMAVDKLLVFFGHGEHVGRPPNLLDLQAPERRG